MNQTKGSATTTPYLARHSGRHSEEVPAHPSAPRHRRSDHKAGNDINYGPQLQGPQFDCNAPLERHVRRTYPSPVGYLDRSTLILYSPPPLPSGSVGSTRVPSVCTVPVRSTMENLVADAHTPAIHGSKHKHTHTHIHTHTHTYTHIHTHTHTYTHIHTHTQAYTSREQTQVNRLQRGLSGAVAPAKQPRDA